MRRLAALAGIAVLAAACSAQGGHPDVRSSAAPPGHPAAQRSPAKLGPDPHTTAALIRIATVFNNDYDNGIYGPVWDRWDARSQAIIARADYIQRHTECPDSPQSVQVEDARRGPGAAFIVDYQSGGVQSHDYWFYQHRRWVFDLPLSNPSSVALYKLSPQKYVAALGCAH